MLNLKRKTLSINEKIDILNEFQCGEKNSTAYKKYGLYSSSISTFWMLKNLKMW